MIDTTLHAWLQCTYSSLTDDNDCKAHAAELLLFFFLTNFEVSGNSMKHHSFFKSDIGSETIDDSWIN